jgi:hypothetical protein
MGAVKHTSKAIGDDSGQPGQTREGAPEALLASALLQVLMGLCMLLTLLQQTCIEITRMRQRVGVCWCHGRGWCTRPDAENSN